MKKSIRHAMLAVGIIAGSLSAGAHAATLAAAHEPRRGRRDPRWLGSAGAHAQELCGARAGHPHRGALLGAVRHDHRRSGRAFGNGPVSRRRRNARRGRVGSQGARPARGTGAVAGVAQ